MRRRHHRSRRGVRSRTEHLTPVRGLQGRLLGGAEHHDATTHRCYRWEPAAQPARWADAQAFCKAWGGDLAAITSGTEYAFLLSFVGKDTWIGASDIATEGAFTWTTQEPFVYTSWGVGYPEDSTHTLNCVTIGAGLTWQDRPCNSTQLWLCERAPLGKR